MAIERDRPYSQFNFLVSWEGLDATDVKAGFQEISGLGMEITVAEYRAGNFKDNAPMKITGTYKVPDITLKRGVIGATNLYEWLEEVRNGAEDALKDVTIELLTQDRSETAVKWELKNARPTKYTGPALNGKGTDVAIEELVLASERIVLETA
jgi:phage tail-like protein